MTVLITDDDAEDREVLKEAIRSHDPRIRVDEVSNGLEALKWLESNVPPPPSLIFMDINMPMMNGIDALKSIKEHSALKKIPVVMYSTSSDARDVAKCKKIGASEFFVKPDSYMELYHMIQPVIKLNVTAL